MEPGFLHVVFEGVDCSGKTSQVEHLRQAAAFGSLSHLFSRVRSIREPSVSYISEYAHAQQMPRYCPKTVRLMEADRLKQNVEVVEPNRLAGLKKGVLLIQDRSWVSTAVYNGPKLNSEMMRFIQNTTSYACLPDIIFYLGVTRAQVIERHRESGKPTPMYNWERLLDRYERCLSSPQRRGVRVHRLLHTEDEETVREAIAAIITDARYKSLGP